MKAFGSTYLLRFLLVLVMSCMAGGCRISYKLNGAAIDYTVYKTIYVSNFPIRAALVYPPLQQTFENELLDYITRNTRLRTIDTNNADLQLEGEIVGYNLSPQAVTENAYASRTRLTIQVKITYTDNRQEGKDISQTFSAYRDFDSSEMLTDVQDQLCSKISKELVDLIFNATLGDW
ncbi:LptE family protein [uncultured Duncaniella sp.]|uniref:LptE family protein n=1 Tax=uncultured Duncaniella sp. TaxID=2768039 RepID=UPI0025976691|nr:LptE family protein [uncultured Duncaniella sp.]